MRHYFHTFLSLLFLLTLCDNVSAQKMRPIDQLNEVVKRDKAILPISLGSLGAITQSYLDKKFYTCVCEVYDIIIYDNIKNNIKKVKKTIIHDRSSDADFRDTAQLLLYCDRELKYIFVYSPDNTTVEIVLTKKDLKKILK